MKDYNLWSRVLIALAILGGSSFIYSAIHKATPNKHTLTVMGHAEKRIKADEVEWSGNLVVMDSDAQRGHKKLNEMKDKLAVYLTSNNISLTPDIFF